MSVIARLNPKSGLPDFGIKLSKSETSDFDAIQYPTAGGYWIARSNRAMTGRRSVNLIGKCSAHEAQPRAGARRLADVLRRGTRRRLPYDQSRVDQCQYGREGGLAGGLGRTLVQDRALDRVHDHGKAVVRNCNGGAIVVHWPWTLPLTRTSRFTMPPWGPVLASGVQSPSPRWASIE